MNLIKFIKTYQADIVLTVTVILISITAFNLGKLSAFKQQKVPLTITEPTEQSQASTSPQPVVTGPVMVSKNSTGKVYHFSWCPGASKIAEKNKITFTTETAAISAGYTLAGNCQK